MAEELTREKFLDMYGEKGSGFIRPLSDINSFWPSTIIDSGSFGLNVAHGIGGIKTGSVIRLMGPPGLGKSSLAYRQLASAMSKGMSAMIIDTEGGTNADILYDTLVDYGLDADKAMEDIFFAPPTNQREMTAKQMVLTLERTIPMVERFIISKKISPKGAFVLWDSLDFTIPESTTDAAVDQPGVALVARMMKNWLRKFNGTIKGTGSVLCVIHQVSSKVDAYAKDTETFSGGNALAHVSSFSLRLKDLGQFEEGGVYMGKKVKGMITKSKQGIGFRTFEFVVRNDVGPDKIGEIFDAAKKLEVITGSTWVEIPSISGEMKKIQGRGQARTYFMENPSELRYVEGLVMSKLARDKVEEIAPAMSNEDKEEYRED